MKGGTPMGDPLWSLRPLTQKPTPSLPPPVSRGRARLLCAHPPALHGGGYSGQNGQVPLEVDLLRPEAEPCFGRRRSGEGRLGRREGQRAQPLGTAVAPSAPGALCSRHPSHRPGCPQQSGGPPLPAHRVPLQRSCLANWPHLELLPCVRGAEAEQETRNGHEAFCNAVVMQDLCRKALREGRGGGAWRGGGRG